jgi:hypothetical protein
VAALVRQAELEREMAAADRAHNLRDRELIEAWLAAALQRRRAATAARQAGREDRR